jgi:uncharacterized repeat protein (TIGR03803 family)
VLYGTTTGGGGTGCASFDYGCGTLFKITQKGVEKVLHVFGSGSDGIQPQATLLDVRGALYGTTAEGGGAGCGGLGCGTVFKFDLASGVETVVHSFTAGADGELPEAGLINFNGTLYGTTVFGGGGDGGEPVAGLLNVDGTFYGTTLYNFPTVFKVKPDGTASVLHFFSGGSRDGSGPEAGLTNLNGVLYGTTVQGGGTGCPINSFNNGCGTVFKITKKGVETVLYSFQGGSDGSSPWAKLVDVNGTLYGVTAGGGSGPGCRIIYSSGCGTLFSITPEGVEKVLHVFGVVATDGTVPMARMLNVGGTLYGTTSQGGKYGFGTVFKFTP